MITIIPAIDIIDGKCVRLTIGDFNQKKVYHENPVDVAEMFEQAGVTRLHLVDLDGARLRRIINWRVLEEIADRTKLKIDFGGGVQTDADINTAFECGATQITAGSIAIKKPAIVKSWLSKFGSDKIILGADVKNEKISIHAWEDTTDKNLIEHIEEYKKIGITHLICTDISKDGMLLGPAFDLYNKIKTAFPEIYLIASGGISKIREIDELNQMNIDGVITGKALYENRITLQELKPYLC